jgi:tripartite-type tricarboxylate transporter receptor subunit TctC
MRIRSVSCCAFALVLAWSGVFAQAVRAPGRMLVGYPPGGAVDVLGQLFFGTMSEALGRPVRASGFSGDN